MSKKTVTVDAAALRRVLNALLGQPHEVRELQETVGFSGRNPIRILVDEYSEQMQRRSEDNETP